MCDNCGFPIDMMHNPGKQPVVVHACPRCGHKLRVPITLPGTQTEGEGNPARERKTLLD